MTLTSPRSDAHLTQVIGLLRRRLLPARIPLLSRISVCKKIGLGYVPAVGFMLAVAAGAFLLMEVSGLEGAVARPLLILLAIGTVVAAAASIAAMLTAFSVGERVRCVLSAAEAGARGDLDQHVEARPDGDEVDRLAASFNAMTSELRRQLEAERRARREAQLADEAKSRFLSTMSHELRTPLTVLIGCSALLEESAESKLSSGEVRYLQQLQQTSEYLLAIVNESLDIGRIEAGETRLELALVPLDEILDPVFDSIGPLADDRQHFFSIEPPTENVHVMVDPVRVRQLLYNLLSNAIKFTRPGGSVTLRAQAVGGDLLFEVEDTGIGIPAEFHGRVFERFERLHGDRIRASGAGLGLAVTKQLVELHAGEIRFESTPDVGTTFFVRLPAAVASRGASASLEGAATVDREGASGPTTESGRGLRILLVDDEPVNTWLFADVLQGDGYEVVVEHEAQRALNRALDEPFDALLIDIRMPGMRGDELCRRLRSAGVTLPIIAISANAMPTEVNEGLSAGFDAYLTKPIAPVALRKAVREVIDRPRAVAGARWTRDPLDVMAR